MCTPSGIMPEDTEDSYGLTMRLFKHNGRFLYGHLGSSKPYATSLMADHKTGYGVVCLMNTYYPDIRTDIPKMIFDMMEQM